MSPLTKLPVFYDFMTEEQKKEWKRIHGLRKTTMSKKRYDKKVAKKSKKYASIE